MYTLLLQKIECMHFFSSLLLEKWGAQRSISVAWGNRESTVFIQSVNLYSVFQFEQNLSSNAEHFNRNV
jgi:hypothetical protein